MLGVCWFDRMRPKGLLQDERNDPARAQEVHFELRLYSGHHFKSLRLAALTQELNLYLAAWRQALRIGLHI